MALTVYSSRNQRARLQARRLGGPVHRQSGLVIHHNCQPPRHGPGRLPTLSHRHRPSTTTRAESPTVTYTVRDLMATKPARPFFSQSQRTSPSSTGTSLHFGVLRQSGFAIQPTTASGHELYCYLSFITTTRTRARPARLLTVAEDLRNCPPFRGTPASLFSNNCQRPRAEIPRSAIPPPICRPALLSSPAHEPSRAHRNLRKPQP